MTRTCEVQGCGRPHNAQGLCLLHYSRALRAGELERLSLTEDQRFWAKVDRSADCWLWTAGTNERGYGLFHRAGRRHIYAHRFSWVLANGEIADGLLVCHTCDNPTCVNPSHLFLGTHRDNALDMMGKGRGAGQFTSERVRAIRAQRPLPATCFQGHEYTEENTRIRSDGSRVCRTCVRERARRARAHHAAEKERLS